MVITVFCLLRWSQQMINVYDKWRPIGQCLEERRGAGDAGAPMVPHRFLRLSLSKPKGERAPAEASRVCT